MTPADTQTLKDAVARGGTAVLSLPSAGLLRHHRTRFLMPEDQEGFWLAAPDGERTLITALLAAGKPVGVSLRAGTTANKLVFTTIVRQYEPALPVNEQTAVDALLLAWPDQVQSIQRRAAYRVTVAPGDAADVRLRVWRIPEHHHLRDKAPASALLKVTLRDLSAGGMGLLYSPRPDDDDDGDPVPLADDQRLRITLAYGDTTPDDDALLLEGRVRHVRPLPGENNYRLGVQFKKLEDDLPGRQALATLTQIVGHLQRAEIRRRRIALSRKTA